MDIRHVFAALLTGLLVACGGDAGSGAREARVPADADTMRAPSPAGSSEVALETVADDPAAEADTAAVRDALTAALDAAAPAAAAAETADTPQQWRYSAGEHFSKLTTSQGTSSPPGTVEVAEVFWYGCPHCFSFDPFVSRWAEELPDKVSFVRVPVMWNPTNEIHARVFYTAEALGKLDEMHEAIFEAFHEDQRTLTREADIRALFADYGVSEEDFERNFRSFGVESKLKRAKKLTQRYRIRSVPVLVVNGKYVTDGPQVRSFEDMLGVAEELVERERSSL